MLLYSNPGATNNFVAMTVASLTTYTVTTYIDAACTKPTGSVSTATLDMTCKQQSGSSLGALKYLFCIKISILYILD